MDTLRRWLGRGPTPKSNTTSAPNLPFMTTFHQAAPGLDIGPRETQDTGINNIAASLDLLLGEAGNNNRNNKRKHGGVGSSK